MRKELKLAWPNAKLTHHGSLFIGAVLRHPDKDLLSRYYVTIDGRFYDSSYSPHRNLKIHKTGHNLLINVDPLDAPRGTLNAPRYSLMAWTGEPDDLKWVACHWPTTSMAGRSDLGYEYDCRPDGLIWRDTFTNRVVHQMLQDEVYRFEAMDMIWTPYCSAMMELESRIWLKRLRVGLENRATRVWAWHEVTNFISDMHKNIIQSSARRDGIGT